MWRLLLNLTDIQALSVINAQPDTLTALFLYADITMVIGQAGDLLL